MKYRKWTIICMWLGAKIFPEFQLTQPFTASHLTLKPAGSGELFRLKGMFLHLDWLMLKLLSHIEFTFSEGDRELRWTSSLWMTYTFLILKPKCGIKSKISREALHLRDLSIRWFQLVLICLYLEDAGLKIDWTIFTNLILIHQLGHNYQYLIKLLEEEVLPSRHLLAELSWL